MLGILFLIQFMYFNTDIRNFPKYFGLRGDFIGNDDFINYLYRMKGRTPSENIIVTIGGDVRYGGKVMKDLRRSNIPKPLAGLAPVFAGSDINFVSLDGPITDSNDRRTCTETELELNRCCSDECFWRNDPTVLDAMKELGINGIAIENDHTFDYGREGLEDTLYLLRKKTIPYSGMGYRLLYRVKDCNVTVLSYNWAYQSPAFYERVKEVMVSDLKVMAADTKIVIMHSGNQEGGDKTAQQEQFAKAAIDHGANVVIGTHSRVRQGSESYKDRMIYYGLGSILDENVLGNQAEEFSLVQFEIAQCRNIVNMREVKAIKNMDSMEVILL